MKLEKLSERHEQEINAYRQDRAKRLFELQKSQSEIIGNCLVLDKKTRKTVDNLLTKQRQTWEKMEKDELDLLLHIQSMEKESLMKDEEKRLRLIEMLTPKSDKDKDRGR
jgi:hypothetical protein